MAQFKNPDTATALETEVREQHAQIAVAPSTPDRTHVRTDHPDAQWFANAGLGLFIHWGISSVSGEGDLSWSMMARSPDARALAASRYGEQAVQKTFTP